MTWPMKAISEVCVTGTGTTPPRSESSKYFGGPVAWVKSGELSQGVVTSTEETLTEDAVRARNMKVVEPGALLVALYGATVGQIAELGIRATTNQAVCHIVPNPTILDRRYLFHALRNHAPVWIGMRVGGAQPNISQGIVKDTRIPVPPLTEQRRIAAILDKADAIRRKREEGIRLTEELLRSTFLDMFGDPATNPKGWAVHNLEDLVATDRPITYGILKPGPDIVEGIPYVRVVDIKNQRIAVASLRRTSASIAQEYRRSTLKTGDILLSIRGHVGRCAVVPDAIAGANITQDTARIAPRFEWARSYTFWCLQSESMQRWMSKHVRGVAVKGINLGDVKKAPVPLPPEQLCARFDRIQELANKQHDVRLVAANECDAMFESLVQRAFRADLESNTD